MALTTYRQKRDFASTREPKGIARRRRGGHSFVVQKHDARRLHYDFRLEMDGVLKSWAVTRGPSLVPGDKRLAVHVEDHPLEYGDFEGTIPKGQYGGGTVVLWDRGDWKPLGDAAKGLKKGHLEFELSGEKLRGRWHLVRMASRRNEKRENWLLIKGDDPFARDENAADILEEQPDSVKSGKSIEEVAGKAASSSKVERARKPAASPAPKRQPKASRKSAFPGFVEPALATLRPRAPSGDRWIHEIKFDGYRLQAHLREGKAKLLTRSGLDWTEKFGKAILRALLSLPVKEAILDGELVVEASGGASDFSALQADLSEGRSDRFVLYLFDLLYCDGQDLRASPLVERKARLREVLANAPAGLRFSDDFGEEGEMVLQHACRLSLEGVVSKLRQGKYPSGRTRDWIKSKCNDRQEFVVVGFVPSTATRDAIGSLVLGYHQARRLVYAGRVGTGFNTDTARMLFDRLQKLAREKSPLAKPLDAASRRGVRFVEPELVAEIEFKNWTVDGVLRHAVFRGLREDKEAATIVREQAMKSADTPKSAVKLTHPDRVYWEDAGVTKAGLADFYSEAWPRMAPFVTARPLALLRCPEGTAGQCFFQKHAWRGHAKEILTVQDPNDNSEEPILAIDSFDGLIGLVQAGTLEIHPWQASLADLEHPDQIVMDLDPGEGIEWQDLIDGAREVRARLEKAGLNTFVKTTGGKGIHVVAPLKPVTAWEDVKEFTKSIADDMASDSPDKYVSTITKSKRVGRILIDYLRNQRGATAIAPYATRARAGATVSMPLEWDELGPSIGPAHFTVNNALSRLGTADPWRDFRKAEVALKRR